jgi:hypothetical protein
MSKPLGYWDCRYEYELIKDIAETWGDNLENISELDQVWLIARLSSHYWMQHCDEAPTELAQEVDARLEELPQGQLGALIMALANKSSTKPMGYWHCDYEYKLILDIAESYNELQDMSEIDQTWLLGKCADFYFINFNYEDVSSSDEADEVVRRMPTLPAHQIYALIQALANK